ncbi:PssE/Cps14G family polysaccharide biosynthesis glycosyltransferase [uncultured Robinsoniella sp.]|uniref:PssE/Cps14G family polysaccharide biosynthesis glycosyltransferase n=1 Tax=uncultured Robinsoniella sp. TaxID=904190 RepID=UPI00374E3EA4
MIFLTLGSQMFQFNRVLKEIDDLIEKKIIDEEVVAQIGYSDYEPRNYQYKKFFDREEFSVIMDQCTIVITHGGTGAIISAVKKNKKVIAVPRLKKYGEHVDDHQLQLLHQFSEMNLIHPCYDLEKIGEAYLNIESEEFMSYISNTKNVIMNIQKYIEGIE